MSNAGLAARSISAVFWGAGGTVVRMVLQMGAQVVLARLLGPTEYGVFAIGTLVITFSLFFADVGLAYGLIQKPSVDSRDIRFVFTWQIILGSTVATMVALAAGPIAGFFGEPRAAGVVRVLSVLCLINALAAPAMNLLKRELNYRALQLSQILSYFIGFVLVGIPLALAGQAVWSLVAAWSVQAALGGLFAYAQVRHPIKPLFWYEHARSQGSYGGVVLATNLLNWLIANVDRSFIGRWLPSRDMGLYSQTYNLLYSPSASLLGVIQPVFFSAASRVTERDEGSAARAAFLGLIAALALFVAPVFVATAVLAEPFVLTLYGPKWQGAAAVCAPLALAMPFFLMVGLCTPLLWTAGRPSDELRSQLPMAVGWALLCAWAAQHSVVAVAWAACGFFALRLAVVMRITAKRGAMSGGDLWRALRGGLVVCLALSAALAGLDLLLAAWPGPLRFVVAVAIGLPFVLGMLHAFPQLVSSELRQLLAKLLDRLPERAARWLAFLGPDMRDKKR
ncbi:lipopolysaccharide biosynthesis protein [Roseateles saccharophilus]|uniref:O-antigen/teichoic acid export membrane protein n=1 Tax=Roseateles saccharophilus TaxID=304 RepID=A0A4R3UQZ9_ROSSA|nr:lipopolysaccharide biosynthesis protein [Roseateles saccharophilus]MDG0833432.1 lipopolysaccharide biosynthesis protein [Roseateles saccharophilus]TCU93087.1 O-antigen/teichoic acid export membrane protein [Roseateles saccharophilus]